jgi:NAD(P)-dependent dehydrogenase (short-subunit alcohol dehydrogenase family)
MSKSIAESFEDRVVVVTGGGSGIGAAAAVRFAEAGAKVVIAGRTEATLVAVAKAHRGIGVVVADLARPAEAARLIGEVRDRHGALDVLVNNAGVAEIAPLAQVDVEHVRRLFDTNVIGLIEVTRHALPLLERARGTVINVASTAADAPAAAMSVYGATKAAVLALTRAWAQELAPLGVRVNAVSPGPIETPIFDPAKLRVSKEVLDVMAPALLAQVPMARFGKPEEVAAVIGFLASRAASYVTGAQYSVGGGLEA